jgi:motility quorum-sensing regulator/GCU-specific mRNA interferase toxin
LFNSLAMGLTGNEAVGVVLTMTRSMFYKSMTTHADPSIWQDVYHAPCPNGKTAYIKVTLRAGAVVIQFKEL